MQILVLIFLFLIPSLYADDQEEWMMHERKSIHEEYAELESNPYSEKETWAQFFSRFLTSNNEKNPVNNAKARKLMILALQREFGYHVERIEYNFESKLSAPSKEFFHFLSEQDDRYAEKLSKKEQLQASALMLRYSLEEIACSKDFSDIMKDLKAQAIKEKIDPAELDRYIEAVRIHYECGNQISWLQVP